MVTAESEDAVGIGRRPTRRVLADVGPLRESATFRRLWVGSTMSAVGNALTTFAIPLQVYDLTRSPFDVGLTGVVEMAPTLTLGLLGGSAADTRDRRKLVLLTSVFSAAFSGGLAVQAFVGLHLVLVIYVLAAAQSVLGSISGPARRTFIPSLLPTEQLPAGLALNRLSFQVTLIAGPALAGLITSVPALGLRGCYLIDAVSFAASLYGVAGLPTMRRVPATTEPRSGQSPREPGSFSGTNPSPAPSSPISTRRSLACPSPCSRRSTPSASVVTRAPWACSPRRSAWGA